MSKHIRYNIQNFNKKDLQNTFKRIKRAGFSGVVIPAARPFISDLNGECEFFPVDELAYLAREQDLDLTLEFNIFESWYVWKHQNFSAPVKFNNSPYYPAQEENYYPICPNNPLAEKRIERILSLLETVPESVALLISEMGFPFNWMENNLDIQNSHPPFCYCPFCLGEFSEYIDELVTEPQQVENNFRYWMDWRINVIYKYFVDIFSNLIDNPLIISIPPLSLIDLPFVTGQIPIAFLREDARIAPPLLHVSKNKNFRWVIDQLRHYELEMDENDLIPILELNSDKVDNLEFIEKRGYQDVIYDDWDKFLEL